MLEKDWKKNSSKKMMMGCWWIGETALKYNFWGIHKCDDKYDSFTIRQNDIMRDEAIFLGFVVLEFLKLVMHDKKYDKLPAPSEEENIQLH